MTIKAVILDVSGTMLTGSDGSYLLVKGIPEMISRLRKRNVAIFTASNDFVHAFTIKQRLNLENENVLYRDSPVIGGRKGERKFVQYVCSQLQISPNELLYLGDSQNDCNEAVNSNVAFFLAAWSNPNFKYGIPVETPLEFAEIIETFFLKDTLWYYRVDDKDGLGRKVTVRALLDPDKSKDRGITDLLKSKGLRGPKRIGTFKSDVYLSMHLFASVYLEGLHLSKAGRKLIWCMYPGHDGHYTPILNSFVTMISRQSHTQYWQDLLQRHIKAIRSSSARSRGSTLEMDNQLQTIQLNPSMREKITKRSVIVIDDFTTEAHSFETARNFLFNAGVESVTCIAVGKYPKPYIARYPKDGITWDSFMPVPLTENDFASKAVRWTADSNALKFF